VKNRTHVKKNIMEIILKMFYFDVLFFYVTFIYLILHQK